MDFDIDYFGYLILMQIYWCWGTHWNSSFIWKIRRF